VSRDGLCIDQKGNAMKTHKDLEVWRASIDLARNVYELTRQYPKDELFGLVSQMRRASVSIASNIAEGAARNGNKEFLQFLYIALGSASELDTQIEISKVTRICEDDQLQKLQEGTTRVRMLISGLIRSVKRA
jgi:four helix bundle protein